MDIEQKKEAFYSLIRARLETNGDEEIFLSDSTLEENHLNGRVFWEVICPLMEKEGKLREFNDPEMPLSEFNLFLFRNPEYSAELDNLTRMTELHYGSPRFLNVKFDTVIDKKNKKTFKELIEDSHARLDVLKTRLRKGFRHRFVVAREAFLHPKGRASSHVVIEKTPSGASWRGLQIRFINGDTLLASLPMQSWNESITRSQLGLEKKSGQLPKEQWRILEDAAQNEGRIEFTSTRVKKDSWKKQVGSLENLLKAVFPNLTGEPLESAGRDGYKTVFEILPEQQEDTLASD